MTTHLCISVRLLDAAFHGRADGNDLEWPPSPLRLFQSLVSAAAARWRTAAPFPELAAPAFRWMETLGDPVIITPLSAAGAPYRLSVPNNAMDVVARAWSRGNTSNVGDANPATHRTMKTVRPMHLLKEDAIHYVWQLSDADRVDCDQYKEVLFASARSVVALGWGIDMAVGNGQLLTDKEVAALPGEQWRPVAETSATRLRVPRQGTLNALTARHKDFLNRLPPSGGFVPVPPLTTFETVGYRRGSDISPHSVATFEIWKPVAELATLLAGKSKFRPFDAVRKAVIVSGMVRHSTARAAGQAGWLAERINSFIHGHTPDGAAQARGGAADHRFAYFPLPSLERRGTNTVHVGMIRRVLVVGQPGGKEDIAWVRRALSGQELFATGKPDPIAMLSVIAVSDRNLQPYLGSSAIWSTVTPVILPGYDDRNDKKTERLLRNTLTQAGFPSQLRDKAELEWRAVGYRPGLDHASRYFVGSHHERLPRYHVRIRWPVPVRGPICLGTGRYYGMGLFATEDAP
jgi:CRISPR-associated protein Csb2